MSAGNREKSVPDSKHMIFREKNFLIASKTSIYDN